MAKKKAKVVKSLDERILEWFKGAAKAYDNEDMYLDDLSDSAVFRALMEEAGAASIPAAKRKTVTIEIVKDDVDRILKDLDDQCISGLAKASIRKALS